MTAPAHSTAMSAASAQELEGLRLEVAALRLCNEALQQQLLASADQTEAIIGEIEAQRNALRLANRQQQEAGAFVQRIIDAVGSMVLVLGLDGGVIRTNRRCGEFLGMPPSGDARCFDLWMQPKEAETLRLALPALPWPVRSVLFETVRRRGRYLSEHQLRGVDGQYRDFLLEGTLLHNRQGKEEGVVINATDIALLKQAEADLRLAAGVFDSSLNGITITSPGGVIQRANRAFSYAFGYSAEEAVGHNISILKSDRHDQEFYRAMWQSLLTDGFWQGEIENRHKDGHLIPISQYISAIRDAGGVVTHYIGIFFDLSASKALEGQLREAKLAADAASNAKGAFLANMSHEIRTPMNAVIGLAHLLQDTRLTPKQADYLHKIISSSKAMLSILNDILDYSKIEAGQLDIEEIDFSLNELLQTAADLFVARAEEKNIELSIDVRADVPLHLRGDPLRLGQVLQNLLGNAVKFTAHGTISMKVELRGLMRGQDAGRALLEFSVQDTGIGLTAEQAARLFQPFSQADASITRKFGGTGLGLTISRRLLELMGGEISVDSIYGHGTTFRFGIELGVAQELSGRSPRRRIAPLKVLVVDDNEASRVILQAIMESAGLTVTSAASARAAIAILEDRTRSFDYDLFIIDWKMPQIDGLDLARHIRHLPSGQSQIIMMTNGFNEDELRDASGDIRIDGVLSKPYTASSLFNAISQMGMVGQGGPGGQLPGGSVLSGFKARARSIRGARVLLVEDNRFNQQVASEFLQKAGLLVDLAQHGGIAIDMVAATDYDVVLMDMHMPEMDGLEATRRLRASVRGKHLPIIAMTAAVMKQDRDAVALAGMNDHIAKPIDPDRLLAALLRWVPARSAGVDGAPEGAAQDAEDDSPLEGGQDRAAARAGPAQAAQMPALEGINLDILARRLDGKLHVPKLLRMFADCFRDLPQQLTRALAAGDSMAAARLMHGIKGAAGNVSASQVYDYASLLEKEFTAARRNPTVQAALLKHLAIVIDGIDRHLNRVKTDAPLTAQTAPMADMAALQTTLRKLDACLIAHKPVPDELFADLESHLRGVSAPEAIRDTLFHTASNFDFAMARQALATLAGALNMDIN